MSGPTAEATGVEADVPDGALSLAENSDEAPGRLAISADRGVRKAAPGRPTARVLAAPGTTEGRGRKPPRRRPCPRSR